MQTFLFGAGRFEFELSGLLSDMAATGYTYDLVAHSQGGIQLGTALRHSQGSFAEGSTVSFRNTPLDPLRASLAGQSSGLQVNYDANPFDLVTVPGNPWLAPTAFAGTIRNSVVHRDPIYAHGLRSNGMGVHTP